MKSALVTFSQRFDRRFEFFRRVKSKQAILELGCGQGDNFYHLGALGATAKFYGVDIMPLHLVPSEISYQQVNLDTENLPFVDCFFDAIIFTHVIEHLHNPLHLGHEIQRVLKPGGVIYVETPNWTSIFIPSFGYRREQMGPFNFFDDPTHTKPWTKEGLFAFLQEFCHLHVEQVGTVRNWLRFFFDPIKILLALLTGKRRRAITGLWNLYGWCIYAVGVKQP